MARYSLYPGFVKIEYTGATRSHKMVLPVIPSLSGSTWQVRKLAAATYYNPWTAAVDALVLVLKPFLNTGDEVRNAELWTLASEGADPQFREVYNVAVAGTDAAAAVPYSQMVMTHRTAAGNLLRTYLMETTLAANARLLPPFSAGKYKNLSDFLLGATTGFVFGRDGAVPIAPIAITTKYNDALRKKILLGA